MDAILNSIGNGCNFVFTKIGNLLGSGFLNICKNLGDCIIYNQDDIISIMFLICCVGMLVNITGNTKLGTKLTSFSITSSIIIKVVSLVW